MVITLAITKQRLYEGVFFLKSVSNPLTTRLIVTAPNTAIFPITFRLRCRTAVSAETSMHSITTTTTRHLRIRLLITRWTSAVIRRVTTFVRETPGATTTYTHQPKATSFHETKRLRVCIIPERGVAGTKTVIAVTTLRTAIVTTAKTTKTKKEL